MNAIFELACAESVACRDPVAGADAAPELAASPTVTTRPTAPRCRIRFADSVSFLSSFIPLVDVAGRVAERSCSRLAESSKSSAFQELRSVVSYMTRASQNLSGFAFSARWKPRSANARSSSADQSNGLCSQPCFSAGTRSCPSSACSMRSGGMIPPASAAHSLESYVSRLRRALSPYGVAVERRGGGYRIDLGGAVLDSQVFEELVDASSPGARRRRPSACRVPCEGGTRPLARPCSRRASRCTWRAVRRPSV